jgi:hypothetical protein
VTKDWETAQHVLAERERVESSVGREAHKATIHTFRCSLVLPRVCGFSQRLVLVEYSFFRPWFGKAFKLGVNYAASVG